MRSPLRSALMASAALVLVPAVAAAQQAAIDEAEEEQRPQRAQSLEMEEIVVTGRPGGDAIRKLDAAYAINTFSNEDIEKFSPKSTADVFKSVPGVWVESSGGEAGANIMIRGFPGGGDAPFVTVSMDGMPVYPASTLSFLENSSLFRIDETVERLESIRGGVNAVFNKGEIGGTFNFLLKEGGPETEGLIKASFTDFGEKRVDAVVSGPVNDRTTYMVGGFYRSSDGLRGAEFNSERGGQITAKIAHEMDNGHFSIYGRYLDDNVAWLLPIPVLTDAEGNVEDFPGFDRGDGNLIGNDTRLARLEVRPGEFIERDLGPGRGANIFTIGGTFFYELGNGWELSEKFNYMKGDADTFGLVPATVPQTLSSFVEGLGGDPTIDSAVFTGTGDPVSLNQQVMTAGWWSVEKDLQSFTNDLSFSKNFGGHRITAGMFFADYSSEDLWFLGNNQLLAAEENARRIDVLLADGRQVTRNGFVGGPFFNVNASFNNDTIAGYIGDEWEVNDRLRIDAALRIENQEVDGTLENNDFGVDLDGDPNTLFNNSNAVLNGTFRTLINPATGEPFDETELSVTVGGNYALNDDMGVFARFSRGHKIPQFDSMRDGNFVIQDSNQYEVGFKANTDYVSVFSTFFFNDFKGLPFAQQLEGQEPTVEIGTSSALGVELELVVTPPVEGVSVRFQGTWQEAEFDKLQDAQGNDLSGNRLERQPRWQTRITPTWETPIEGFGYLTVYGTFGYVGKRFSDGQNQQPLPSYTKLDAGVILDVGENFYVQVVGDNIGDSHGLTEGNPRLIGSQGVGPIFARPILGRSFRFSAGYRF